ncbi:MAG: UvrD-helicase domain-containing protein [Clostridia bacterium]|nr:UvrD-helicase domain-containing protein [Clostridia bacterium]
MPEINELQSRYISAKRSLLDKKYAHLNEKQREAVYTINGPLLVLAGAGTGKTTLLVNRIAYILSYGDAYMTPVTPVSLTDEYVSELERAVDEAVDDDLDMLLDSVKMPTCDPWQILSITFTNKAANEMRARLKKIVGDKADGIWSGTFHAMCLRILRRNAEAFDMTPGFTIYDESDSKKVMTECMKQMNIDDKTLPPKLVLAQISRAKDKLMTPADFDSEIGSDYKLQQISSLYTLYQARLEEANALDFDDIIMKTVLSLRSHPDVLDYYQRKFRYVLVDEFQDTNYSQFELTSLLSGGYGNIMVVGDDDQSIYKFRGATIENILRFDEKIPDTKIIKLEQNYRSTSTILGAANDVIRHNFGRRGKELWTSRDGGEKILVKQTENQIEECKFIVNKILELKLREHRPYSDFAVLYRINAQSNVLESVFTRSGVPHRVLGGQRFFDRKEIKDVLAYLSVISNPSDNLRLKRIINEPKRKIGEATISAVELLADSRGTDMFDIMQHATDHVAILRSASKLLQFVDVINSLRNIKDSSPLHRLVEMTIEMTGYRAMLIADEENGESPERRENVDELISTAVEYEKNHEQPTLAGFLEEISLVADIDNYDETSDAVTLMTIHSAKGLEFPVVFIPGMEESIFPGSQAVMVPDELEEERRLAYVAITRARDRLYLLNARERLLYGHTLYNERSRFIGEIGKEYISDESLKQKQKFRAEFGEKTRRVAISDELLTRSSVGSSVGMTHTVEFFSAGDRVRHITFGAGTVMSALELGADVMYEIAFDDAGTKKLMATYAKLKKE